MKLLEYCRAAGRFFAPGIAPRLVVALAVGWPGIPCNSLAQSPAPNPYDSGIPITPKCEIDRLVLKDWDALHLQPANVCTDPVFVRRAYLDIIGTLPSGAEARDFILDRSPNKRSRLVDRLLERDEFADYWAMKWGDLLRIKAEFPINLWPNAAQTYHRWVRTCLKQNVPYDRFARDLLTASGSNFRSPPANFYRAMQNKEPLGIAQTVALNFMGERADKWPKERLADMAAFFCNVGYKTTAEWKEEIVYFDPLKTNALTGSGLPFQGRFPDGAAVKLTADRDPREAFTDWLLDVRNPWFAKNIVNRIWYWLLGRGIVHEPDDIRPDNPAANPELLAYLEGELVKSKYDLQHIYRLILNSTVYQLSSIPKSDNATADAHFAHYPLRRLDAEVLIDAIDQITGGVEEYSSPIPEPFTYIPPNQRSIGLSDGSITSPFLELFGRPPRDTGVESERNNRPTAAQTLHLLNSSHIQRKIEQSRMIAYQTTSKKTPREMAVGIYLGILSRFPTEAEQKAFETYAQSGTAKAREAAIDLAWALINNAEFLYRH